VFDLSPLESSKSLVTLNVISTKVTAAGVAALQKALPNCKIDWDDPAKTATPQPASNPDPDRKAAEWVLAMGGRVVVSLDGSLRVISAVGDLPAKHFSLINAELGKRPDVSDSGLAALNGLSSLERVYLSATGVGDAGMKHLRSLPMLKALAAERTKMTDLGLEEIAELSELQSLKLADNDITDAGLVSVGKFTKLTDLNLNGTKVTGEGLRHLTSLKLLKTFIVGYTALTDDGLKQLATFIDLENLNLNGTKITDVGLQHLKALRALKHLELKATKVTATGVNDLQKVLPNCKIDWDDPSKATSPQPAASGTK
jgi:Leucine-rich repeat (LRR) protein